jgi:hypothetical protein
MRVGIFAAALAAVAVMPGVATGEVRPPERAPVGGLVSPAVPPLCAARQSAIWDIEGGGSFSGHLTGHVDCPAWGSVVEVTCEVLLVGPSGQTVAASPRGSGYGANDYGATCDTGQLDVGPLTEGDRGYSARFNVALYVRGLGMLFPTSFCPQWDGGSQAYCSNDLHLLPGIGLTARFE